MMVAVGKNVFTFLPFKDGEDGRVAARPISHALFYVLFIGCLVSPAVNQGNCVAVAGKPCAALPSRSFTISKAGPAWLKV